MKGPTSRGRQKITSLEQCVLSCMRCGGTAHRQRHFSAILSEMPSVRGFLSASMSSTPRFAEFSRQDNQHASQAAKFSLEMQRMAEHIPRRGVTAAAIC